VHDQILARLQRQKQDEAPAREAVAREKILILEAQHAEVEKELERQKQRLQGISKNSLELDLKRAEIDQAEATIKMVRAEKERLRVELQATSQRVTQCQEAEVPKTKNVRSQIK
jgi:hypothetical protein